MKHLLLTTIAAVVLVGCGTTQSPHKAVFSDEAPAAIGPYSQAVQVGDVVYLAGQIGIDPPSGVLVEGGIQAQTKQALDNLGGCLKKPGWITTT
jgi:enamine deaminase RidA (YjgF/YER057c/UK114 family)